MNPPKFNTIKQLCDAAAYADKLDQLLKKLGELGKKNGLALSFAIHLDYDKRGLLFFELVAGNEKHTYFSGWGYSINEMIQSVLDNLCQAIKEWRLKI